jgi:hypothetical protein
MTADKREEEIKKIIQSIDLRPLNMAVGDWDKSYILWSEEATSIAKAIVEYIEKERGGR